MKKECHFKIQLQYEKIFMRSFCVFLIMLLLPAKSFSENFFDPKPMNQSKNFFDIQGNSNKNPATDENQPNNSLLKDKTITSYEMQALAAKDRELELAQKALIAGGDLVKAAETGLKRIQLRSNYQNLQGLQAITNFDLGDNVSLSNAMSRATGRQIGIQPLTNGNFNLIVDGRIMRSNMSHTDIKAIASSMLKLP
jgi:hypothetical protein